jgi:hypothetical protein
MGRWRQWFQLKTSRWTVLLLAALTAATTLLLVYIYFFSNHDSLAAIERLIAVRGGGTVSSAR